MCTSYNTVTYNIRLIWVNFVVVYKQLQTLPAILVNSNVKHSLSKLLYVQSGQDHM